MSKSALNAIKEAGYIWAISTTSGSWRMLEILSETMII
jgi:hypothetical protein